MYFTLILLSQKSIWWRQPAIGAEMKGRGAVFSRNPFFFCCFLLLLRLSFSTDLALCICSHNSEVWQGLMASNLVSLTKEWHMGHWVNVFVRGGKRQKLGLCVCASPCPASQLLLARKPWHSIDTKCTVALTEGRGGRSVFWLTHFIWDFNFNRIKNRFIFIHCHFLIEIWHFSVI